MTNNLRSFKLNICQFFVQIMVLHYVPYCLTAEEGVGLEIVNTLIMPCLCWHLECQMNLKVAIHQIPGNSLKFRFYSISKASANKNGEGKMRLIVMVI